MKSPVSPPSTPTVSSLRPNNTLWCFVRIIQSALFPPASGDHHHQVQSAWTKTGQKVSLIWPSGGSRFLGEPSYPWFSDTLEVWKWDWGSLLCSDWSKPYTVWMEMSHPQRAVGKRDPSIFLFYQTFMDGEVLWTASYFISASKLVNLARVCTLTSSGPKSHDCDFILLLLFLKSPFHACFWFDSIIRSFTTA